MKTPTHYVLIVANRTATASALLDRVRRRALRGPCAFTLLVPAAAASGPAAERQAHASLTRALPLLAHAAGGPVLGIVEPVEPLLAVQRTLEHAHFDEALVSTLPVAASAWLRADLPARIERPWLPVGVVTATGIPEAAADPRPHIRGRVRTRRRRPDGAGARMPEAVALRDGAMVVLRPVTAQDDARLARFVDGLSEESSHSRFLGAKARLSEAEIRYLTHVDHHDHEALLALDRPTGALVGVARYIRAPHDAQAAELAVVVADEWQRRGLGSAMVGRLVQRARASGIRRVRALVLAGNRPAITLLEHLGPLTRTRHGSTVEIEVEVRRTGGASDSGSAPGS